jgi:indoleacetamide hydrolase
MARARFLGSVAAVSMVVLNVRPTSAAPGQQESVRQHLERRIDVIQHSESSIKAFVESDFAAARTRADELDAGPTGGSLEGVVIAVKDNIHVDGFRTSAGTRQLAALPIVPTSPEAEVVKRLRAQGAIIVGTTNMDTWARGVRGLSEVRGQTANPRDLTRNAGGSSAGSAAAVAADMVDMAIGTDTCGSVRYPASSVGIYGLRPTWGAIPLTGVVPLAPGQDVVGPLAKSPEDLRRMWDVLSGFVAAPKPPQPVTAVALKRRIGVLQTGTAVDRVVLKRAQAAGFVVIDAGTPPSTAGVNLIEIQFPIAQRAYLSWRAGKGSQTWITVDGQIGSAGEQTQQALILKRRAALAIQLIKRMNELNVDALVQPVTTALPAPLGQRQASGNCMLAAGSGLPALAVPGSANPPAKVSIGVEFIGRPHAENALLAVAELIK